VALPAPARARRQALERAIRARSRRASRAALDGAELSGLARQDRSAVRVRPARLAVRRRDREVNGVLGTDGVFAARARGAPQDHPDVGCGPGTFAVETRFLHGSEPLFVQILSATECVAPIARLDHLELRGVRDLRADRALRRCSRAARLGDRGGAHRAARQDQGLFQHPHHARSDQVAQKTVDKKTGKEKIRSKRRLDFLRRYEHAHGGPREHVPLDPRRAHDYTITVGGPLLDATGKEIIGHFLEEQKIRVRRGATTTVDFDFRPRECAVEVNVREDGRAVAGARVAVAGDRSSLRYARDGVAYLYLGRGEYTILVGSKDAAAEFRVRIDHLESAIPLHVDLADVDVVFRGCPAAVEPYLVGDHAVRGAGPARRGQRQRSAPTARGAARAVGALEGRRGRARGGRRSHPGRRAARVGRRPLEVGGLYEQSGNLAQAAAAHRAAGEWAEAARCYEEIYDYGNALECWREQGDEARQLDLLEKLGEYQDAAQIARAMGDGERAIRNLQLIDARHPD
jgi:hypothetical protein